MVICSYFKRNKILGSVPKEKKLCQNFVKKKNSHSLKSLIKLNIRLTN